MGAVWLSPTEWTGSDPTAEELAEVEQWERRKHAHARLVRLGVRVGATPAHPFYRPGQRVKRVKLGSTTPLQRPGLGRIVGVR